VVGIALARIAFGPLGIDLYALARVRQRSGGATRSDVASKKARMTIFMHVFTMLKKAGKEATTSGHLLQVGGRSIGVEHPE
jgi:hypothetical protein